MFHSCSNLTTINFGNINTSLVQNLDLLFYNCNKIAYIDLSKFDTSKVTSMYAMFFSCRNLETINFGNINTSSLENMRSLFNKCNKISSINLSNFDTSRVTTFKNMFKLCNSLKYLDLSNFKTSNLLEMDSMFLNCTSLIYLNLYSFKLNYAIIKDNAFKGISPNLTFCVKDNYTKNYLFGYDSISECLEPCSNEYNKKVNYIFGEGCVKSCLNKGFEYEYKNACHHDCPNNTYILFNDNEDNINNSKECFDQTPLGYYLDINEKIFKKCYLFCESCYGERNETYNNCVKCKNHFKFYNNSENIINCYPICNNYYYFNESNIFHCTENLKCPEKYNKLILDKGNCIDECKNDDIYKYEYNNDCYQQCPDNMFFKDTNNFTCIFNLTNNENIAQRYITTSSNSQVLYECKIDDPLNNNCNFIDIKNETEIMNIILQS